MMTVLTFSTPGVANAGLFSVAVSGTKHVVEHYIETVAEALDFIADGEEDPADVRACVASLL